jgi:hypothetical protein
MGDPSQLRAGDSERDALAEELREHMLAGRLAPDEFEERVGAAYKASTRADLDALRSDLPPSPAALERSRLERRRHLRRRLAQEAGGAASISLVCVGIWLASGASGRFWPIWVIIFTLLPLLRDGWRLFGPAPDERATEARLEARSAHRAARGRRHSQRRLPR